LSLSNLSLLWAYLETLEVFKAHERSLTHPP
jgi:hypothetical protein